MGQVQRVEGEDLLRDALRTQNIPKEQLMVTVGN